MTSRRRLLVARCMLLATTVVAAQASSAADGLSTPADDAAWPTWQMRLSVTTSAPGPLWSASLTDTRRLRQASLLGDVYLGSPWFGQSARWRGGLRATGGVLLGPLGPSMVNGTGAASVSLWALTGTVYDSAAADLPLRPYFGVGYAGLSVRHGWGVSADLGLVAGEPGALLGSDALTSGWRRLDLQPVVRFGVSYAF
ncbi:MAG: hypothetical protein ABI696_07385 [Rubrivivax sp.]